MTKESFFTLKWNNIIAAGLGIPVHVLMVYLLMNAVMSPAATFWVIQVAGAIYWIALEQHAGLRFAQLRKSSELGEKRKATPAGITVFVIYNVVYWFPMLFALLGTVSWPVASTSFACLTFTRLLINVYRLNLLPPDKAEIFPLRAP